VRRTVFDLEYEVEAVDGMDRVKTLIQTEKVRTIFRMVRKSKIYFNQFILS
jgi:hypothetical protein